MQAILALIWALCLAYILYTVALFLSFLEGDINVFYFGVSVLGLVLITGTR